MKLNYKRTFLIGLAFLSISAFWQMYDNIIPLMLQNTFGLGETITGALMAADNVFALFLLPVFGTLSDKVDTGFGKRMPFIVLGTLLAVSFLMLLPIADEKVHLPLFIGALFAILVSMGLYRSPAVALMPDLTPNKLRSKGNAVINLMGAVGGVYTLIMIKVLVKSGDRPDYRPLFISLAALMIGAVLVLVLTINERKVKAKVAAEVAAYEKENGISEEGAALEQTEINKTKTEEVANEDAAATKKAMPKDVKRSIFFLLASIFLWFTAYNAVTTAFSRYTKVVWHLEGGGFADCLMVATVAAIISYIPIGNLASKVGRKKTILFVDEIHRFNKGQQDYLLPFVEDGTIILIGATTENPYFEVNSALLSRSIIFELKKLDKEDIKILLLRAVNDVEKGMGSFKAEIDEDALEFLADVCNGDARAALTAIELGILTTDRSEDGKIHITIDVASECIQKRVISYDKTGDNHYDTISAFIKSMRGSDPDAAVYYLARMLYAGEDIKFIARRIMICASEDVGNADPMALVVATSASQAIERIGMPEAQIILSQAVTYVACAPKSNAAYEAIGAAMSAVRNNVTPPVPTHLQDAHYKGAEKLGHGLGYKYAHAYPNHYVEQQYLPDALVGTKFYEPTEMGYEKQIREHFKQIKVKKNEYN